MSDEIPLYCEPLIGWRVWRLMDQRICSLNVHAIWEPYAAIEAQHRAPSPCSESPCPNPLGVACGIHAFKTAEAIVEAFSCLVAHHIGEGYVVGQVALWGRIDEHELGYRAQWAYPVQFYYTPRATSFNVLPILSATYGLPYKEELSWPISASAFAASPPHPSRSPSPPSHKSSLHQLLNHPLYRPVWGKWHV